MTGDRLPDTDHISRYCKGSQIKTNGSISGAAFLLRKNSDEKFLSVNWLEFLNQENREGEIGELQRIFATKFNVSSTAKLAVLNIGEMRNHVRNNSEDRRNLRVLHEPEVNDPSHSGIYELMLDDALIGDLIA